MSVYFLPVQAEISVVWFRRSLVFINSLIYVT